MNLLVEKARAYVYCGNWVADCPRECGNVEHLFNLANPQDPNGPRTVQKTSFFCSYCHMISEIDWPPSMNKIMEVLNRRPVPHNRNWYPQDHPVAVRHNIPHGQSVDDLWDENTEHGVV